MQIKWGISNKKVIKLGIGLLVIGLAGFIMGLRAWIGLSGDVQDFNTMDEVTCQEGAFVEGEISSAFGYYCEEEITKNGTTTSRNRIYLIPFGENQKKFIGIKVSERQFSTFEQLTDETYAHIDGNTLEPQSLGLFQGEIKKCDTEILGYLEETFADLGEDVDSSELYVPYYIECTTLESNVWMTIMGGVASIIGGILLIGQNLKKKRQQKIERETSMNI